MKQNLVLGALLTCASMQAAEKAITDAQIQKQKGAAVVYTSMIKPGVILTLNKVTTNLTATYSGLEVILPGAEPTTPGPIQRLFEQMEKEHTAKEDLSAAQNEKLLASLFLEISRDKADGKKS